MSRLFTKRRFLQSVTYASGALVAGTLLSGRAHSQEEDDGGLEILPYLQNPAPDAMTVCFLSRTATVVKVQYGKKGGMVRTLDAKKTKIPKTDWTVWKLRLTGLQPGALYNYRVRYTGTGKEKQSDPYTFTTFNWSAPEMKAIAFNDGHDKTGVIEELMKHVKSDDFQFSMILGDMWNDPSPSEGAARVFETMAGYVKALDASNKPMLYIRGNHDTRGGFAGELSYLFDLPNNNPADTLADQNAYHDFRCGPVWFISPDAGEDAEKRAEMFQPYRERQVGWLKNLFAKSPAKNAPWRVVPLHIPLYTPGGWDQPDALKRWEPVLNNEKIDLMIAGHDHAPHFVPKGKPFKRKGTDDEQVPPYPVLVGGGPNMSGAEVGTVMLIKATARELDVRMIDTTGKKLHKLKLKK